MITGCAWKCYKRLKRSQCFWVRGDKSDRSGKVGSVATYDNTRTDTDSPGPASNQWHYIPAINDNYISSFSIYNYCHPPKETKNKNGKIRSLRRGDWIV